MATDFYTHRAAGFETPGGVRWPVRPKDIVGIPQQPRILAALEKFKCTAKVVDNGYDIINEKGDAVKIDFGVSEEMWEEVAKFMSNYRG